MWPQISGILDFGFWGFWILDFGDFGFWGFWILGILDFGFRGFWILDFKFWIFGTLCSRSLCAKLGFWNLGILDFGFWGFWILDFGDLGFWILDWGFWMGTLWQNFGCYIRKEDCARRIGSADFFSYSSWLKLKHQQLFTWTVSKLETLRISGGTLQIMYDATCKILTDLRSPTLFGPTEVWWSSAEGLELLFSGPGVSATYRLLL